MWSEILYGHVVKNENSQANYARCNFLCGTHGLYTAQGLPVDPMLETACNSSPQLRTCTFGNISRDYVEDGLHQINTVPFTLLLVNILSEMCAESFQHCCIRYTVSS